MQPDRVRQIDRGEAIGTYPTPQRLLYPQMAQQCPEHVICMGGLYTGMQREEKT